MCIAKHLHFDMARVAHQFLHVDFVVAKRRERFTPGCGERRLEILLAFQHPHAAPTAAPACLEHQRIANSGCKTLALAQLARQRVRGRHHRHTGRDRRVARRHLVAEHAHDLRRRADPTYARVDHGLREIGILREETVAWMNRVDVRLSRDAQNVVDIEVGGERLFALTDEIALVGLEAMKRETVFL